MSGVSIIVTSSLRYALLYLDSTSHLKYLHRTSLSMRMALKFISRTLGSLPLPNIQTNGASVPPRTRAQVRSTHRTLLVHLLIRHSHVEVIDERFLRARGEEAYSCAQVDAWALGATLFNTLCAVNLWTIADVSELCFYMFTRLPHLNYVYHNFPVSREANALLRDTLALDPGDRLDIAGFRARVAAVHTFFPDAKQLAGADESVQEYIRYNDYYAEVAHKSLRSHDAAAAEAGDEVFTVARPSCKERPVAVALGPAATMSGSAAVAMPAPPSRFSVGSATSASSADSSAPATPQTRAVHAAVAPSDSDVATLVLDASEPDAALTPPTSAFTSLECEAQRGRKGLLCRTIRRVKGSWRRASLVLAG